RPTRPSSVSTSMTVRTNRPQWQPLACRSGASSGTVTLVALISVIFMGISTNAPGPEPILPEEVPRPVFSQSRRRPFDPFRQGAMREGLEVQQHGVPPPGRVSLLDGQPPRDVGVPLRVDRTGQHIPLPARAPDPVHPTLIVHGQLVPERPARAHPMIPRH